MGLFPLGPYLEPANILLGYFDFCSIGRAAVRNDYNIILSKETMVLKKVLNAKFGTDLFIGYE